MNIRKNSPKIIKVSYGYQTNCSSGMWVLSYFLFGFFTLVVTSFLSFAVSIALVDNLKRRIRKEAVFTKNDKKAG